MRWPVVAAIAISSFGLAEACVLAPTNLADGAPCETDDECKSHGCYQGSCRGSSCNTKDASSCAPGWKCIHTDADPITAFFGATGSTTCHPLCGSCPSGMFCRKEDAAKPGTLCSYGKPPLEISVPAARGVVGQPLRLTAVVAAPAGRIASCTWRVSDGSSPEMNGGLEITRTFQEGGAEYSVDVSCTDDGGRSGEAEGRATIDCQALGSACDPTYCCADANGRRGGGANSPQCYSGDGPGSHVCRPPRAPTITIDGPTSIPVRTDATFTATAQGDAEIDRVEWRFSDSGFGGGTKAVTTHRFDKVGAYVVFADVTDRLAQSGRGSLPVTVCQPKDGACSSSAECCPSLTCKPSGTASKCL